MVVKNQLFLQGTHTYHNSIYCWFLGPLIVLVLEYINLFESFTKFLPCLALSWNSSFLFKSVLEALVSWAIISNAITFGTLTKITKKLVNSIEAVKAPSLNQYEQSVKEITAVNNSKSLYNSTLHIYNQLKTFRPSVQFNSHLQFKSSNIS